MTISTTLRNGLIAATSTSAPSTPSRPSRHYANTADTGHFEEITWEESHCVFKLGLDPSSCYICQLFTADSGRYNRSLDLTWCLNCWQDPFSYTRSSTSSSSNASSRIPPLRPSPSAILKPARLEELLPLAPESIGTGTGSAVTIPRRNGRPSNGTASTGALRCCGEPAARGRGLGQHDE